MATMLEPGLLLSIVTVVRNDLDGLKATIVSVDRIAARPIEHIVIDGSTNDEIRAYLSAEPKPYRRWISEPDKGIYDAMNKGLARSAGRYATFINAGDMLAKELDWAILEPHLAASTKVLQGYVLETFAQDRYLNPGLGKESGFYIAPQHQGTYYPRAFYASECYVLNKPVGADMDYSYRALKACGGLFVPAVVCQFQLGGVSSNYDSRKNLAKRVREQASKFRVVKLYLKYLIWRVLPRRWFYRFLAMGKYTKVGANLPALRPHCIPFDGWR
jgi:putative colanic acid biosynthesis glycosyltransferase